MNVFVRSAGAMLSLALCAACATGAPEADSLASLTVGVAAPVMQQASTSVGITYNRDALTRETMVTLGIDGRPAPRVLESWTPSGDGLTWRLKVRPGIRFHDGTPATAPEIAASMDSMLIAKLLGTVESIEPDGADTIVVRLKERYAFLPEDLAQVTAVRTVHEKDEDGKVIATRQFGTGPYAVAMESADRLELRAFPHHYRGDPDVTQVEVKLFPDQRNAWSALMRNEIDVLYEVSRDSLDFVRSESTINVATFPRAYVYVFAFNASAPALKDPAVRRAINLAIDRTALLRTALSNEGEVAAAHVWPRHWAHDASVVPPAHDPQESIRLMEQAGLFVKDGKGAMPARLRLKCAVYEPFARIALVLQRQLAEVDIDLQLETFGLRDLAGRARDGNYETFLFEMTTGRTMLWPYLFWHSTSPFVKHGYTGADEVLDRMRVARNDDEMRAATSAFQRRLIDDPPAAFLAWGRVSRAVTKRFELPPTDVDIYHTIPRWKPAAKTAGGN
jgi:peptide/nickel transport system substrate-binding protein